MPGYAAAVAVGVLVTLFGNNLVDPLWSALAPILVLFAGYRKTHRLLLLAAAAALWSNAFFHYQLQFRLVEDFDGWRGRVAVVITDLPSVDNGRVRLEASIVEFESYPARLPRRVRLSWYQDRVIPRAGEYWQLEVKLRQPRARLNPAGFDYEKWMFVHGVDATGYITDSAYNQRLATASRLNPQHWRTRLALAIDRHCPDCSARGLIKALALGYRGDIDRGLRYLLQASGTAHLLAISGLHIGLVAMFAFWLGRIGWRWLFLRGRLNRAQVGALAALVGASAYAALAGFTLPTVRALIMLVLVLLTLFVKTRVNLLQSLSIAAILIMLLDPAAPGSASFWLSLGALLVIAYTQFHGGCGNGWWAQLLRLQFYFSVLFAPLGLLIFAQLTPAGLLANLVAIPLISFIVLPLVLLASLLLPLVPELAGVLLAAADYLLRLLLEYLGLLLESGLGPLAVSLPAPLLLMLLLALAWLLLPRGLPGRGLALVILALLPLYQPQRPQQNEFEAVVLDVGQGTSVLLRTRHHSLVYDFGPGMAGGYSAAESALIPLLRHYRSGPPDLAVVSHVDQDHSGGLPGYLRFHPDARLLSGNPDSLRQRYDLPRNPRSCHGYPAWRWDGVDFRFFSVAASRAGGSNNTSCVLLVAGYHRLLLPGDIEASRERELVAAFASELEADVVLAPHHGSATSSSPAFISRVKPRYVVYTVGRGNRWGFPDTAVSERYAAVSAEQLRSDRDGAIGLFSREQGLSLRRARVPPRRIWRRW